MSKFLTGFCSENCCSLSSPKLKPMRCWNKNQPWHNIHDVQALPSGSGSESHDHDLGKNAYRHLSHPDGLSNEEEAYVRPLDIPVVTCGITYSVMFYHFNPTNQKNMDFNSGCFLMAFQFKQLQSLWSSN